MIEYTYRGMTVYQLNTFLFKVAVDEVERL